MISRGEIAATIDYYRGMKAAEKAIGEGYVYVVDFFKFDHECGEQRAFVKPGPCSHNRAGWLWRFAEFQGCGEILPPPTVARVEEWFREIEGVTLETYLATAIDGEANLAALSDPRLKRTHFLNFHCPRDDFRRDYTISMTNNPYETYAFTGGFNHRMAKEMLRFPSNFPSLVAPPTSRQPREPHGAP